MTVDDILDLIDASLEALELSRDYIAPENEVAQALNRGKRAALETIRKAILAAEEQ